MDPTLLSGDQKRAFRRRMDLPVRVFAGLILLLGTNILFGLWNPFPEIWIVELGVLVAMIVIIILFSMETIREPPLVRLFSIVGFCWVAILFGMTLIDYLTRSWPAGH